MSFLPRLRGFDIGNIKGYALLFIPSTTFEYISATGILRSPFLSSTELDSYFLIANIHEIYPGGINPFDIPTTISDLPTDLESALLDASGNLSIDISTSPHDPESRFVVYYGAVYRSSDYGDTWRKTLEESIVATRFNEKNSNIMYALAANGDAFRSDDSALLSQRYGPGSA